MKIPIVKYSDKFLSIISPFMGIKGITLYPFIILKERFSTYRYRFAIKTLMNHETIHIKQQEEMLVIFFYILYFLEWFLKLFVYGSKSYRNISFEREAYKFEDDLNYLSNRKHYAFIKYIFKK